MEHMIYDTYPSSKDGRSTSIYSTWLYLVCLCISIDLKSTEWKSPESVEFESSKYFDGGCVHGMVTVPQHVLHTTIAVLWVSAFTLLLQISQCWTLLCLFIYVVPWKYRVDHILYMLIQWNTPADTEQARAYACVHPTCRIWIAYDAHHIDSRTHHR